MTDIPASVPQIDPAKPTPKPDDINIAASALRSHLDELKKRDDPAEIAVQEAILAMSEKFLYDVERIANALEALVAK